MQKKYKRETLDNAEKAVIYKNQACQIPILQLLNPITSAWAQSLCHDPPAAP